VGASADFELGEDLGNVVLDRLAGQEKARRDLRVGQTLGEQREHLGLSLGQATDVLRPDTSGLHTELAQESGGLVGVTTGAEVLEGGERRPRFTLGKWSFG
jgi:hypothetical protein